MQKHGRTAVPLALALALRAGAAFGQVASPAPAAANVLLDAEPVPRTGYTTWSLFLVTNQDWLVPEGSDRLRDLYRRFDAFGKAIGREHVAVWFWKRSPDLSNPNLTDNVDVERAVAFCRKLGAPPSRGPYILFTTEYPDEQRAPDSYQLIELEGKTSKEIGHLLKRLGDQIVLEGIVRNRQLAGTPGSEEFWGTWFTATRRALAALGGRTKFRIQTPFFTVDTAGG